MAVVTAKLNQTLLTRRGRNATCLALTLLLAAGLGVLAKAAQAQSAKPKKTTTSKAGSAARGKRTSKKSSRRERGQKVPTPDRISEIQQALANEPSFASACWISEMRSGVGTLRHRKRPANSRKRMG